MITIDEATSALSTYVNAPQGDEYVAQCAQVAHDLITRYIGAHPVPTSVVQQALNEVGANLYQRRSHDRDTSNGVDIDGAPAFFRPALDPLTPAYPIIRPYLSPGIA